MTLEECELLGQEKIAGGTDRLPNPNAMVASFTSGLSLPSFSQRSGLNASGSG